MLVQVDSMAQNAELWTGAESIDVTAAVQGKSDDSVSIEITSAAKTSAVPNAAVYSDPNAPAGAGGGGGGEDEDEDEDFIAAANFRGKSPGYVFKMGSKGVGYYQDSVQRANGKLPAAASSAAKGGGDGFNVKNMFNSGKYTSLGAHQAEKDEDEAKIVEIDDDEAGEEEGYEPLGTARLDRYNDAVAGTTAKGPPPFMPPPGGFDIDESDIHDPPLPATAATEAKAEVTMPSKPSTSAADELAAMLGPAAAKQAAKQAAGSPSDDTPDNGPSHQQDLTGGTMLSNSLICELE